MSVGNTPAAAGNFLSTTVTATPTITMAGWVLIEDVTTAGSPTIFAMTPDGVNDLWLGITTFTNVFMWSENVYSAQVATVAVNDWVYAGFILNGTTLSAYMSVNNAAPTFISKTTTSVNVNALRIMQDWTGVDHAGSHSCFMRVWNAALTQSELDQERSSPTAVRTANLLSDSPLPNMSSMGAWTMNGTHINNVDSPYVVYPPAAFPIFGWSAH
jgi:hypothetical protein